MAITPPRAGRFAHSRISAGSRSGGRCSTTCEQKMPSSVPSSMDARYGKTSAISASRPLSWQAATDAARRDGGVAHHFEKLAAPAADIEHIAAALEIGQVESLSALDILFRPAEAFCELRVIEGHGGGCGRGFGRRR